jgi:SAM-dependent methyltransferase
MAESRGHFSRQEFLLKYLLRQYNIFKSKRILDAACGTGDALIALNKNGFMNLSGIDSSLSMLTQFISKLSNGINVASMDWENIRKYFKNNGNFDLIFMLGHSLPHMEKQKLNRLLGDILSGLNKGGIFVFDIRNWQRQNGCLSDPNRTENVYRKLDTVNVDGKNYRLEDKVSYKNKTQYVTYRLTKVMGLGKKIITRIKYEMFDYDEVKKLMIRVGFKSVEKYYDNSRWPYVVIIGRKN